MLSNDQNIERFADFVEEAKRWVLLKKEYTKLDIIEKVVRILTALTIALVIALLVLLALIYASFAVAYHIAASTGSLPMSFAIVALFYIIILTIVLLNRRRWIEKPMVKFLISIFNDNQPQA